MKRLHIGLFAMFFLLAAAIAPFTYNAVKNMYVGKLQPGNSFGNINHTAHHGGAVQ